MAQPVNMLRELNIKTPPPTSVPVQVAVAVTEPFQQFYAAVGAKEPWQRLALGFALGSVVMFLQEPDFAFDPKTKQPRPWSVTTGGPGSTFFHWTTVPLVLGLASALFI